MGIAGSGRVAQALGRLLRQQGERIVCVASRHPEHARAAADFIEANTPEGGPERIATCDLTELPRRAERLLIAVADSALEGTIATLARSAGAGGVALHTSGARDLEDFAPLQAAGWACGTLHPLQTVADGGASFRGASFAINGDAAAVHWARELAERLGGRAVSLLPGQRPLYHAAAVMASNYTIALLDAASELMAKATGAPRADALQMLAPLARAAMENALTRGPVAALTGPLERGDVGTVALHLEALETAPARLGQLYRAAGTQTLELARRRGLSAEPAAELEKLLNNV